MSVDTLWIFGIAIMFGLAILMTFMTYKDMESFFAFLTIFSGFTVWAGLLPLWVLIVNLIILTLIIINGVKKRRTMM